MNNSVHKGIVIIESNSDNDIVLVNRVRSTTRISPLNNSTAEDVMATLNPISTKGGVKEAQIIALIESVEGVDKVESIEAN